MFPITTVSQCPAQNEITVTKALGNQSQTSYFHGARYHTDWSRPPSYREGGRRHGAYKLHGPPPSNHHSLSPPPSSPSFNSPGQTSQNGCHLLPPSRCLGGRRGLCCPRAPLRRAGQASVLLEQRHRHAQRLLLFLLDRRRRPDPLHQRGRRPVQRHLVGQRQLGRRQGMEPGQ